LKTLFAILLVALGALTSCATYRFQPLDQGRVVKDGITVQAWALIAPEMRFDVTVTNASGKSVTVDSDQFLLYAGDKVNWSPVRMIPNGEMYQRAENQARTRHVVLVEEPGYRRTTTTTVVGGGGMTVTRIERQPQVSQVYVVSQNNEEELARFKAELFFSAVLDPGKSHSGAVFSEYIRTPFLKLVVPVDGQDFEIVFERVKVPGPFKNLN